MTAGKVRVELSISNSQKISSTGPNSFLIAENEPRELVDLFKIIKTNIENLAALAL